MSNKEIEDSLQFIKNSRRAHERFHFVTGVTVTSSRGSFQGKSNNLSLGGLFLTLPEKLEVGEIIEIRLELPGIEESIVKGEVRWSIPKSDNEVGCGLKFTGLTSSVMKAIVTLSSEAELREI